MAQVYADFCAFEFNENKFMSHYIIDLERLQHFYDHLRIGMYEVCIEWFKMVGARDHLQELKNIMTRFEMWGEEHERAASLR